MSMKKYILFGFLFFTALSAWSSTLDTSAEYVYSSDFNRARAGAALPLGTMASVGLQGQYIYDKTPLDRGGFKDPAYSVYLPMQLDLDLVKLNLTPFYYFKNKSTLPDLQDSSAYGLQAQVLMDLRADETEGVYTQAYVGVGYANQKASVWAEGDLDNRNYRQMAYTLGLRQDYYNAFVFHVAGTAYQYPDGIDGVDAFRGVMDQNDLAFTQSYDVSRQLGKYVLSARLTRVWSEQRSTLYAGYHYAEFYTADPQHSVLAGNSFYVANRAQIDAAYNHLQTTNGKNKRDIFYIHLNLAF